MDILTDWTQAHLSAYFHAIDRGQRFRVKFFICAMCQPDVDIAKAYFPNANIIIDNYHFLRNIRWSIERFRKSWQ